MILRMIRTRGVVGLVREWLVAYCSVLGMAGLDGWMELRGI